LYQKYINISCTLLFYSIYKNIVSDIYKYIMHPAFYSTLWILYQKYINISCTLLFNSIYMNIESEISKFIANLHSFIRAFKFFTIIWCFSSAAEAQTIDWGCPLVRTIRTFHKCQDCVLLCVFSSSKCRWWKEKNDCVNTIWQIDFLCFLLVLYLVEFD